MEWSFSMDTGTDLDIFLSYSLKMKCYWASSSSGLCFIKVSQAKDLNRIFGWRKQNTSCGWIHQCESVNIFQLWCVYFGHTLQYRATTVLGSEGAVLMVFSSSQAEMVMGHVSCLSGSSWTPAWAGWDQSSGTCSDTADRPATPRFGDQVNRRNSPGELTL